MGIVKPKYTIEMPENATVKDSKVSWTDKRGKKKIGTLTKSGRVQVESDTWQIRYRDDRGVVRRKSAKTSDKTAALQLFAKKQAEAERVALGIVSREEIGRADKIKEPLELQIQTFGNKQYAAGAVPVQQMTNDPKTEAETPKPVEK